MFQLLSVNITELLINIYINKVYIFLIPYMETDTLLCYLINYTRIYQSLDLKWQKRGWKLFKPNKSVGMSVLIFICEMFFSPSKWIKAPFNLVVTGKKQSQCRSTFIQFPFSVNRCFVNKLWHCHDSFLI